MKTIGCLIVLGMHRSGTSALTGCLHLSGVNLGHSMMPPSPDNPAGYWENNDLVTVHAILLQELGCSWDRVGALPENWTVSDAAQKARKSIRRLLEVHYSGKALWAVKDPRMCRLMPLWLPLLDELGVRPALILTVRHPLEVAGSLARRDGFSFRKGLLLWWVHNRDALTACRGRSHTIVTYEQFLADPIEILKKMESSLGFTFGKPLSQNYQDILAFVQPGLKTQHAPRTDEPKKDRAEPFVRLYDRFRFLSRMDGVDPDDFGHHTGHAWLDSVPVLNELLTYLGEHERESVSHERAKEERLLGDKRVFSAQIFFPQRHKPYYSEQASRSFLLAPGQWQKITCTIPDGGTLAATGVRLDPSDTNGIVHISAVHLVRKDTQDVLFKADHGKEFETLRIEGHATRLPTESDHLILFAYGVDPQIILPALPAVPDCPLELHAWIKVDLDQKMIHQGWAECRDRVAQLENQIKQGKPADVGATPDQLKL